MGRGFFSPLPFLLLLFDFPVFAVLGLIGDYLLSLSLFQVEALQTAAN